MINGRVGYELEIGLKRDIFDDTPEVYEDDAGDYRCRECDSLEGDCECSGIDQKNKQLVNNFSIVGDGSIRSIHPESVSKELKSKIYPLNDIKTLLKDFEKITPFFMESNSTMGTHIHISFNKDDTNYIKLCSWDFVSSFQKAYLKNFKFSREQERRGNKFCRFYQSKMEFKRRLKKQINFRQQRYNSINFMSFFIHRTIEFRLFPSTKYYKRFKKYLLFTVGFINQFLKKKEIKLKRERRLKPTEKDILIEIKENVNKDINIEVEKDSEEFFICAE